MFDSPPQVPVDCGNFVDLAAVHELVVHDGLPKQSGVTHLAGNVLAGYDLAGGKQVEIELAG